MHYSHTWSGERMCTFSIKTLIKRLPAYCLHILQVLTFPVTYVVWYVLLQPLKVIQPDWFWWIEGIIYNAYLGTAASWSDIANHEVYESGADISSITQHNVLVLVNHQTPADILILMRCFHSKNVFPKLMWIMDWIFQFFNFGWVSKGHGDFFLLQGTDAKKLSRFFRLNVSDSNAEQTVNLKKCLNKNFEEKNYKWIILFPEGGLLWKRRESSQRYAKKNDLPVLQHVTLPRVGAAMSIFQTLGVPVEDAPPRMSSSACLNLFANPDKAPLEFVLDVTIGYRRTMNAMQYLFGLHGRQQTFVYYRIFSASDLLGSEGSSKDALTESMHKLFIEKENLLDNFYKTGAFPGDGAARLCPPINCLQMFGIHVFIALSLLLFYYFCCFLH